MSDTTNNSEREKNVLVLLTVATTVLVAVIAGVQAEANLRANNANRASQYYALKLAGELQRVGLQGNYDAGIFTAALQDGMESVILQMTALQMKTLGKTDAADAASLQADVAQARADSYQAASVLYSDPRYAPPSPDALPDSVRYLADLRASAQELLARQNAASDEYNQYSAKADAFTGVLTVLAIALFIFGLAQAVTPGLRRPFALFGIIAVVAAMVWSLTVLL